jgi:toxin ParE1/3/4
VSKVRFTRRAREDLLDIWLYIAVQSPATADKVYDRIEEGCGRLRDFPQSGRVRPEIAKGARSIVVDRWLLLYRLTKDGVLIVRIVDGSRDLARIEWIS